MKLDDLLCAAGTHTLESFDWGPRVVEVINYWVGPAHKVNISMTGTQTRMLMRTLPSQQLLHLFAIDLDAETGEVRETGDHQRDDDMPSQATAPPLPTHTPMQVPDVDFDEDGNMVEVPEPPTRRRRSNSKNTVGLTIASVIAIIALALTFVIVRVSLQTGTVSESTTLVKVVEALAQTVTVLLDPEGATRDQPQRTPSDDPSQAPQSPM